MHKCLTALFPGVYTHWPGLVPVHCACCKAKSEFCNCALRRCSRSWETNTTAATVFDDSWLSQKAVFVRRRFSCQAHTEMHLMSPWAMPACCQIRASC